MFLVPVAQEMKGDLSLEELASKVAVTLWAEPQKTGLILKPPDPPGPGGQNCPEGTWRQILWIGSGSGGRWRRSLHLPPAEKAPPPLLLGGGPHKKPSKLI